MISWASALLGDLGGEVSSRISWMRFSNDFLTVLPESRRITYWGDCCVSNDMESLSGFSAEGDAASFRIGDTGIVIFLMVPQAGTLSC